MNARAPQENNSQGVALVYADCENILCGFADKSPLKGTIMPNAPSVEETRFPQAPGCRTTFEAAVESAIARFREAGLI